MLNKNNKANLMFIIMACMNSIIAYAGAPVNELNLLSIDFNDKLPGSFIGEGGAELGEPVNLSSLTGEIIEDTLDENYLLVENNSGNTLSLIHI